MAKETSLHRLNQEVERLVGRIETIADPALKTEVFALVQSVMEFHAVATRRLLELVADTGEPGRQIAGAIAADDLTGSLLLLHGLHPSDLEERVSQAVGKLEIMLRPHGAIVKLLEMRDGIVRVRLEKFGQSSGCGNTAVALQGIVEDAIYSAAPEVEAVEVENLVVPPVPLVQLQTSGVASAGA